IAPQGSRHEFVSLFRSTLEHSIGQEVRALREGDEQDAVENFLGRLDRLQRRQLRSVGGIDDEIDKLVSQTLVLGIELAGDILVCAVRLAKEFVEPAAQKA